MQLKTRDGRNAELHYSWLNEGNSYQGIKTEDSDQVSIYMNWMWRRDGIESGADIIRNTQLSLW